MHSMLKPLSRARRVSLRKSTARMLVVLLFGAACAKPADTSADSLQAVPQPSATNPTAGSPPSESAQWRLTEYGIGPLRAGMTFAEANVALNGALKAAAGANLAECDYVTWEGGPPGVRVMVVDGKIGRVETSDTSIATAAGARVGDSEARIQSLYPGRVTVTPHKYSDGHYLIVKSANAADSLNFIIFETEMQTVTKFRGGLMPSVEYVEGCS